MSEYPLHIRTLSSTISESSPIILEIAHITSESVPITSGSAPILLVSVPNTSESVCITESTPITSESPLPHQSAPSHQNHPHSIRVIPIMLESVPSISPFRFLPSNPHPSCSIMEGGWRWSRPGWMPHFIPHLNTCPGLTSSVSMMWSGQLQAPYQLTTPCVLVCPSAQWKGMMWCGG